MRSLIPPKKTMQFSLGYFLGLLVLSALVLQGTLSHASDPAENTKKSVSSTKGDLDLEIRENMVKISKQLGVTCVFCHDLNNFRSTVKPEFKIAKDHIRITELLNSQQGFNGNPKVDCFVCHRGATKPQLKDPKSIKAH